MELSIKWIFLQSFAGLEKDSAGFRQGSANYLGSNRILPGSWPHPSSMLTENYAKLYVLQ